MPHPLVLVTLLTISAMGALLCEHDFVSSPSSPATLVDLSSRAPHSLRAAYLLTPVSIFSKGTVHVAGVALAQRAAPPHRKSEHYFSGSRNSLRHPCRRLRYEVREIENAEYPVTSPGPLQTAASFRPAAAW